MTYRQKSVMKDWGYILNNLLKNDAICWNGDPLGQHRYGKNIKSYLIIVNLICLLDI